MKTPNKPGAPIAGRTRLQVLLGGYRTSYNIIYYCNARGHNAMSCTVQVWLLCVCVRFDPNFFLIFFFSPILLPFLKVQTDINITRYIVLLSRCIFFFLAAAAVTQQVA